MIAYEDPSEPALRSLPDEADKLGAFYRNALRPAFWGRGDREEVARIDELFTSLDAGIGKLSQLQLRFLGESQVGKSFLINALLDRTALANCGATPGTIISPSRGRSVTVGSIATTKPGSDRNVARCSTTASTNSASIIAKWSPMHLRPPVENGGYAPLCAGTSAAAHRSGWNPSGSGQNFGCRCSVYGDRNTYEPFGIA